MAPEVPIPILAFLFVLAAITIFSLAAAFQNHRKPSNEEPAMMTKGTDLRKKELKTKKREKPAPAPAPEPSPTKGELESAARKTGISVAILQSWLEEKKVSRSKETSIKEFYRILGELEKPSGKKLAMRQARPS